jgi:hypothetical protein
MIRKKRTKNNPNDIARAFLEEIEVRKRQIIRSYDTITLLGYD